MKRFEKYSRYFGAFVFCIAVIAAYKTFDNLSGIKNILLTVLNALKPFVSGFIIAYVLNMPAKRLCALYRKSKNTFISKRAEGLSILSVYLISVIAVILILLMLIPALYKNLLDLYNNIPDYTRGLEEYLSRFTITQRLRLQNFDIEKVLEGFFGSLDLSQLGKYAQGVFSVTSGVFDAFVAIIASIYMLIDKARLQSLLVRILRGFLKDKTVSSIVEHAKRTNEIFTNYIYSRLACCVIMAVASSIVLMVMKVKYALVLGLLIGAMDMIPYFGSIISCVVSILVTLITGGVWKAVWVTVVLLVMQQIDGNVLGPKIMGESLEIRPFWIIFAVSVGGTLFGFIGMLISVPVVAIIRVIFSDYMMSRENKMKAAAQNTAEGEAENDG